PSRHSGCPCASLPWRFRCELWYISEVLGKPGARVVASPQSRYVCVHITIPPIPRGNDDQEGLMRLGKRVLMGAAALWLMPLGAGAQDVSSDVFVLGTIVITAEGEQNQGGTSSTVSGEEVLRQNRVTLDDALRTVPGVAIG